jgi:hypothetical protein
MKFKTRNIDYRDLYLDELPVRNESDYTQSREEVLDSVKRIVEEYGFRDYFYENKYKIVFTKEIDKGTESPDRLFLMFTLCDPMIHYGPVDIEFRLDATNHDKAGLYLVVESRAPIGTRNFNQEIWYTDKYIKPTVKAIMDCYNGKG